MIPRQMTGRMLGALVLGAVGLIGVSVAATLVYDAPRKREVSAVPQVATPPPAAAAPVEAANPLVTVTIPPEMLARAGIETTAARMATPVDGLRIPASVQPHGYRQAVVSSVVAGRVLSVAAELGRRVARGDVLAELHSPDAAETERSFAGLQADLTLSGQQIARLDRLVKIGAASQQELDAARAQQTRLMADLAGLRTRLTLVGRTAAQIGALTNPAAISSTVTVVAPIAGTIVSRVANPGQTVDAAAPLFTIVDLDTVWIVGDVYERDVPAVRVGGPVVVTGAAFPGQSFAGRLSYIDPQVSPDTRTARVRIEMPNPGDRFRLGMLMEIRVNAPARDVIVIPRPAVQTIDTVTVVYVADPGRAGTFAERSVRLGGGGGDDVEVMAGLKAGEQVVTSGSFLVRSQRDRDNLGPPRPVAPAAAPAASPKPGPAAAAIQTVDIAITADGFDPVETHVKANTRLRVRFTRKVEQTCVTEVLFESLKIQKPLPVGKPVVIELPPLPPGRLEFSCGMKMVFGHFIVDPPATPAPNES